MGMSHERDPWALQRGALAAAEKHELAEPAAHVLLYLAVRADLRTGDVGPIRLVTILGQVRLKKSAFYGALSQLRGLGLVEPGVPAAPGRLPTYRLDVEALCDPNASGQTETNASANTETMGPTLPPQRGDRFRDGGGNASAPAEPVRPEGRPENGLSLRGGQQDAPGPDLDAIPPAPIIEEWKREAKAEKRRWLSYHAGPAARRWFPSRIAGSRSLGDALHAASLQAPAEPLTREAAERSLQERHPDLWWAIEAERHSRRGSGASGQQLTTDDARLRRVA